MVRTQIQLTDLQATKLKQLSAETGISIAELIRQGVDLYLSRPNLLSREDLTERALNAAGRFSSGRSDVSTQHDEYLTEAFDE